MEDTRIVMCRPGGKLMVCNLSEAIAEHDAGAVVISNWPEFHDFLSAQGLTLEMMNNA